MNNELIQKAKATVGYMEAANKESFMIGVSVGNSLAEDKYSGEIKNLTLAVENYKIALLDAKKDLQTLARIIHKYSTHD